MYRKRASKSALQGVPSGPYTGGPRTIDAGRLPKAVRQRLADVLAYRAEPSPLLSDRLSRSGRFHASWVLVVSLFAFLGLTSYRLGDPRSALAIFPAAFVAAYAIPSAGILFSLLALVRRRARVGGDSLSPGRWLLPLDIVEVHPPAADGSQRIVVTPLGDARDAEIQEKARRHELVIAFAERAPVAFALKAERDGEVTLRRLEHAQHLLEDLTYGRDLEKRLSQDVFFDVRVDGSWADLEAPSSLPQRERWLHGRAATIGAAALTVLVSVLAWTARNRVSDRALFVHAMRENTRASFDAYLPHAIAYRDLALALRDDIVRQEEAAEAEKKREADEQARNAEWRRHPYERCVAQLHAHAASAHPEVERLMVDLVSRAKATEQKIRLAIGFEAEIATGLTEVERGLGSARIESTFVAAFGRVFSDACDSWVVDFRRADRIDEALVRIRYKVVPAKTAPWRLTPTVHEADAHDPFIVQPVDFSFDVRVVAPDGAELTSFHLEMPAPKEPSQALRDESIFTIIGPPPVAGRFDSRIYQAMGARAFDRLYDEVHGLFFSGDPVVPIPAPWIVRAPASASPAPPAP